MQALIINLTRFGDLLQTQPIIHALKKEGYTVGLICLTSFAEASTCLSGLDYVNPIPGGKILSYLDEDWYSGLAIFQQWIEHLHIAFPVDRIINVTSHLPARLLAHHISKSVIPINGFTIDTYGFGSSDSMWAKLVEASTLKRGCSPYNLVDLFRKTGHVAHIPAQYRLQPPSKKYIHTLSSLFETQVSPTNKRYIGFQLGASAEFRQWPVNGFAQLGMQAYTQLGIMPVLFGSESEQHLAEEYKNTGAPCIDLIGKTTLPELAAALSLMSILVTNDTGTMHLAAGLGIPSLAIFLATAQPYDTGPYLEGCCCLEPALSCHPCDFNLDCPYNTICRSTISAESVWPLLEYYLKNGTWPKHAPAIISATTRVWLTIRDSYGFLDLQSLSGHDKEDRSLWLRIQRCYYRQFLDLTDTLMPATPYVSPPKECGSQLSTSFKQQVYSTLEQIFGLLKLIEGQGSLLQTQYIPQIGKKFLSTTHNISTILNNNQFAALGLIWSMSIQERGNNLLHVLDLSRSFQQLVFSWKKTLC